MDAYEQPELELIGIAKDNILGIMSVGSDADCQTFPPALEFAEDWEGQD